MSERRSKDDIDQKIMEKLRRSEKYDVRRQARLHCLIGKTDAILGIHVEPDPHGDETGTHAHFHTTMICRNLKIVDLPEPDRCSITNETCAFVAPLGPQRTPKLRKGMAAHNIIQSSALVEFYGSHVVNKILSSRGVTRSHETLRLVEIAAILIASGAIDSDTFGKIETLRRTRNRFAHDPNRYLKFTERELFQMSMDAQDLSEKIRRLATQQDSA